jgi:hypothetical protein
MLVVKVELHSAITGEVSEIGRMLIDNVGGTTEHGDYRVRVLKRNNQKVVSRIGTVEAHPRLRAPVWSLVAKALAATKFIKEKETA